MVGVIGFRSLFSRLPHSCSAVNKGLFPSHANQYYYNNQPRVIIIIMVGVIGFEPTTSWSQTKRSSRTEPHPDKLSTYIVKQAAIQFISLWRNV